MAELQQRAQRLSLPLPLRYRTASAAEWSTARTHNISGSGILFAAEQELPVGTLIELELALEANGERWPSEIVAQASVVRVVPGSSSSATSIAARFVEHQLLPRQLGRL